MPHGDICDILAGCYPKSFVWTGWHPNDLCYVTPIMKTEDEFFSDSETSVNEVTDVSEAFKEWVRNNEDRILAARERGTEAYFLRDNKELVDGIINESRAGKKVYERYDTLHSSTGEKLIPTEVKDLKEVEERLAKVVRENPEYFARGFSGIQGISQDATFMSTELDGTIYVNFATSGKDDGYNAGESLVSAFEKIKKHQSLTRHEEYAIENLWHEILHNRSTNTTILPDVDSQQGFARVVLETVNQYVARRTYPVFLEKLGGQALHQEWIIENGFGYKETVAHLRTMLTKAHINEDSFARKAEKLLMGDYKNFDSKISSLLRKMYNGEKDIEYLFGFLEHARFEIFIKNLE